jgi:uncharacterized protein (TIGR02145 family)
MLKFVQFISFFIISFLITPVIVTQNPKSIVWNFNLENLISLNKQFKSKNIINDIYGYFDTGTVTDIDSNIYKTVKIGNQWWMAEDLKVTRYSNGDKIPNIMDNSKWTGLTAGAMCIYNNDNTKTHNRLYNWYAVNDSRNIAPEGWHVPSKTEWETLFSYLGGANIAGGKMKEIGTNYWLSPNEGATNESGFSAIPGGYRLGSGILISFKNRAYFWSSTEDSGETAWACFLSCFYSDVFFSSNEKKYGFIVRCVKDDCNEL